MAGSFITRTTITINVDNWKPCPVQLFAAQMDWNVRIKAQSNYGVCNYMLLASFTRNTESAWAR